MVATGVGEGPTPTRLLARTNITVTAVTGTGPPGTSLRGDEEEEITQETQAVSDFDPGEHTVDEVKEYVESHPDELEAVYEAEYSGKGRSTLVTWLEEQFPFDPGEYTVAEVLEYAEANTDQLEDIIVAEVSGKNRSTLVSQLEGLR